VATSRTGIEIDELIDQEEWVKARVLIEKALRAEPVNHWLLTQLAETYYEQRQYKKALEILLRSRDLVADCPLTLWHLAGTLDALGYYGGALRLYTWLLESQKTAADDACWESAAWTNALKTDCVFRIGLCLRHLHRKDRAASCFRRYIDLVVAGATGSYPVDDAVEQIRELRNGKTPAIAQELRKAADWVGQSSGGAVAPSKPPTLDRKKLQQLQEA
jgi:tetratricopeptide (TPR) repeat protein